jgi:CheY-like chemotaxis protein
VVRKGGFDPPRSCERRHVVVEWRHTISWSPRLRATAWRREGYAVALSSAHDGVRRSPTVTDRRITLVVVENDEHVRRALTRFLCSRGYGVRAFDSAEAWLAGICPADGAIIDINLPGMSGLELDERLRREGRAIPTVFITAHDEPGPSPTRRVILQKPLDAQALLDAIEHATTDGARVAGDLS